MNSSILRIGGSVLLILGYFVLLYVDVRLGCIIRFGGNLAMMPFAIKIKTWDVVVLQAFFSVLDASKIIELSL
jgi:hypothetical protein